MNKDVILLNKVRGLNIEVGEFINYDPTTGMYVYEDIKEENKEGYSKKSKVSYILSPSYIKALDERNIVECTNDCILENEIKQKEVLSQTNGRSIDLVSLYNIEKDISQIKYRMFNPWRFWWI